MHRHLDQSSPLTSRLVTSPLAVALSASALSLVLIGSVGCDEGGFTPIPQPDGGVDAGQPPPPPPPPVFPLKVGDIVTLPIVGARTEPCPQGEGFCDRGITASYEITGVSLDDVTNFWNIDATFFYEMTKADTTFEAIARLFYSRVVPLADLTAAGDADDGMATFTASTPPNDEITANGFPFFHYQAEYANLGSSAFSKAANAFGDRILEIDPEANLSSQAANATIGAYFRDDLGDPTYLHKIEIKYHPMGFLCNWEERLVAWSDGMNRNEGDFVGLNIPVAASWNSISINRDGVGYRCSCFDLKCKTSAPDVVCLDPEDPDAEASAEACQ